MGKDGVRTIRGGGERGTGSITANINLGSLAEGKRTGGGVSGRGGEVVRGDWLES